MDNSNGELNGSPIAMVDANSNSTPFSVKDILNIDGSTDPTGYLNCHSDGWVVNLAKCREVCLNEFHLFNSFQSHPVAPSNLYFNCDAVQFPQQPPPPPPYHENYVITPSPNFHSHPYHPYHNSMPSNGIGYDFELNQSYYSPAQVLDSYNQLTNNNNIGIKTHETPGYYVANPHGYGAQSVPPPIIIDHIKTETDSNHSQQLNSSDTGDSPVESSNHSHCDYGSNQIDFNRNANETRSPIQMDCPTKYGSNGICNINNLSKFHSKSKQTNFLKTSKQF